MAREKLIALESFIIPRGSGDSFITDITDVNHSLKEEALRINRNSDTLVQCIKQDNKHYYSISSVQDLCNKDSLLFSIEGGKIEELMESKPIEAGDAFYALTAAYGNHISKRIYIKPHEADEILSKIVEDSNALIEMQNKMFGSKIEKFNEADMPFRIPKEDELDRNLTFDKLMDKIENIVAQKNKAIREISKPSGVIKKKIQSNIVQP